MKSNKIGLAIAGVVAAFGLCGGAGAQLGDLKGLAGGGDMSSLASGSAGNAAGVVEYCVKNNYLGGDAASSVKERKDWSYERWTKEVTKVLVAIENAIWPDLFIAGGGISRKADKWIPLLENRTPVVAAALQNSAGIVGAAMAAETDVTATHK